MFLSINNKLNISLCGMMGSGKSTIGKLIAKKIDYTFIDIDKMIENEAKKTIGQIFEEDGESYFRSLEQKISIRMLNNKNCVISLGGGAITNNNIRKSVLLNSYSIYLKVDVDILKNRLKYSKNRPLIKNKNIKSELSILINEREKFYKDADLVIYNEKSISDTVNQIIKNISNE